MTLPLDITEFLTEHDSIILSLGANPSEITVTVPGLGRATITDLSELSTSLVSQESFDTSDPRNSQAGGPRGYVIKADPETNLYAVWSSVVDNAVAVGTRAELLAEGVSPSRLARADRYGTSAQWPQPSPTDSAPARYLGWATTDILVMEQKHAPSNGGGLLPRSCLSAFIAALAENNDVAAGALLLPLPEDPEDVD